MSSSQRIENKALTKLAEKLSTQYMDLILTGLGLNFTIQSRDAYSIVDSADSNDGTYVCTWHVFEFDVHNHKTDTTTNLIIKAQFSHTSSNAEELVWFRTVIEAMTDTLLKIDSGEITQDNALVMLVQ